MSDLTPELNLALCLDDDDTADYLVTTQGLRGSLTTLDGLFNSVTGHSHNGAHQGGNFSSLSLSAGLTVGTNLVVNGTATVQGATSLTTLSTTGLASPNSLDVTTTSRLRGAVTLDTTLGVTGAATLGSTLGVTGAATLSGGLSTTNVAASGYVAAGPFISGSAGDLSANRNNGTAYVYLGNATHYLCFDGTNYQLAASNLFVNGDRAVTEAAAETLSNKTLSAPAITGLATWNTPQVLPSLSKLVTLPLIAGGGASGSDWIVDYGSTALVSVPNGGQANYGVSFNRAFSVAPFVLVSLVFFSGQPVSIPQVGAVAHNTTTSGFQVDFGNATGSSQSMIVAWIAFGH